MFVFAAAAVLPADEVTNAVTNQGYNAGNCNTTGNLTEDVFSQVASDNAGQPCVEKGEQGDSDDTCDSDSAWNYSVHGHIVFAPLSGDAQAADEVEIRVNIGQQAGGNACTGGASATCASTYFLVEDTTVAVSANADTSVPYDAAEVLLPASYQSQGNRNYQAFYVFARPVDGTLSCNEDVHETEEHN